jgi:dTDP-4-dehydrorhamnose reductase
MKILKILFMYNVIVTGGSGLLGSELKALIPSSYFPISSEFNVCNYEQMDDVLSHKEFDTLLHCAAFTSPLKINENPLKAIDINIIGTANIVKLCMKYNMKVIYISTDYVFDGEKGNYNEEDPVNPVNKYGWSKLGGETSVRMYWKSLIIRLSFGPKIFPYESAFIDQWTSREGVDKVAQKIVKLLSKEIYGIIHIGQNAQTVYDYAKSLDPSKDIKKTLIKNISVMMPKNTSLDTTQYKKLGL